MKSKGQKSSGLIVTVLVATALCAIAFEIINDTRLRGTNFEDSFRQGPLFCSSSSGAPVRVTVTSEFIGYLGGETSVDGGLPAQVIDHLKYIVSPLELRDKHWKVELDFNQVEATYHLDGNQGEFKADRRSGFRPFALRARNIDQSSEAPKVIQYTAKLNAFACGPVPKELLFSLPKEIPIEGHRQTSLPSGCLRPEYSDQFPKSSVWYFWHGEAESCRVNNKLSKTIVKIQNLPGNLRPRETSSPMAAERNRSVTLAISADLAANFQEHLNYLRTTGLAQKLFSSKNLEQSLRIVNEAQSLDATTKTFLIVTWSLMVAGKWQPPEVSFGDHYARAVFQVDHERSVSIYFFDSASENDLMALKADIEKSGLVVFGGHSLLGLSNVDSILESLNREEASKSKLVALMTCHAYMYYGNHTLNSSHDFIFNGGELFDYEGKYIISLATDFLGITQSALKKIHRSQSAEVPLLFLKRASL